MEETYDIKNNLEIYIFSTISEKCYGVFLISGFRTIYEWYHYIGSQHFTSKESDLASIENEFRELYRLLYELYGLSYEESSKYLIIYFCTNVWTNLLDVGRVRFKFFNKK